ncbi:MAG: cellulase family glycosylhydrolase, partial [Kineosporiaceae bacterium]
MKRIASVGAALVLAAGAVIASQAGSAAAGPVGLHVVGRDIVEANGQTFVMRGVNHEHVWFQGQTRSFADIKAAGANTVRVVLGSGDRWGPSDDVADRVASCRQNRLVCVLEVHDTTGYGEESAAISLDKAADYWIRHKSALAGQEDYVVINIGNEPIGNKDPQQWTAATAAAITKLRGAGFQHLLMVDAPNWGQDWSNTMRDNGGTVLAADPLKNTVLSIHMYSVFNSASIITNYLDAIAAKGWPLVVGEFGWQFKAGEVDDQTIMAEAAKRNLGWLAWSWAGNNDPVLDMTVNFDPQQLTTWGKRVVQGTYGLRTAKEASIFSGPGTTKPTTTTPTTTTSPTTTSPTTTVKPGSGFFVRNGRLYESNGSEFVINGINHAHVWYTSQTSSFAAIKAAGANTVRVVLGGGRWGPSSVADVKNVVSLCKTNKLICVLENHDTTGYQEQSGSTSLDAAATY